MQYDLSPITDQLWTQTINLPYPEATDTINREFDTWKSEYDKIVSTGNELTNVLSSNMDLVPQLQQQKRTLDQHVNIASSILQHAKQR